MKVFFRVLNYANRLPRRMAFFFVYSIIGIFFTTMNITLAKPMLDVLFDKTDKIVEITPKPDFQFSPSFITDSFKHYFSKIVVEQGAFASLYFICILICVTMLLGNTFRYLERVIATKIRADLVKNLRMDFFSKISQMHIGYFNNSRKGDLISRFTNDVAEIENAVMNSLKSVLREPLMIIAYFIVLFTISVKLTLFTMVVLPLTGGVLAEIIKRLKKQATGSQESLGRIVNILDETFGGMRVVNAFNARNFIISRLEKESSLYRTLSKGVAYKNELASPVSEILGTFIMGGIIIIGGTMVLGENPSIDASSFMLFLAVYAMIIQPAKNFSNGITSLQRGTASAARIFSIIDQEPLIKSKPDAIELKSFEKSIEFKNVSFAYEAHNVLENINLTIEKGKTLALVGPSGGGKSTLADLVPRFYDPVQGEVLLDGTSLVDYDLESLRKQMGVVTQESILFNDTIYNNIAFGMPHVSEEDVIRAAKIANAHDFISQTDDGYQTYIGERGSKLSGGQRQRLSIARAVLKNPPILILDEATSALDSESEKLVQEALFNLMKNRTSIVIAHRLSTIQHADEIVVIQEGRIAERGSHEQLSAQNGIYRKLIDIQKTV
ncbi:MAG: ABC transporter ATP-binding protein [Cyclobacteriaceae bacterium]|jgi:subfamily B ATP-binding cassette protein MsbA|nr:ABC transporter ATP-binding protein/permease [Flammeovirgaceae bacterium]